ncbi:MAG: glycosyltransferase family 2 protein [Treponemataceae bacterium]
MIIPYKRDEPKLSIIIPVYNTEKYLVECLESVINQTLRNIEIIIVNDCSPANEEVIIQNYLKKDSRIKYFKHEKNLSQGGARNTGIKHATGEFITFIDSDDWIEKQAYNTVLTKMEKHNANLGMFSAINFDDATKKEWFYDYFYIPFTKPTRLTLPDASKLSVSPWNKIYKTSDIQTNKITFPEYIKYEDEEFWYKYITIVKPITIGDKSRYLHYRQHASSTMASKNTSKVDLLQVLINLSFFWKEHNILQSQRDLCLHTLKGIVQWYKEIPVEAQDEFAKKTKELLESYSVSLEETKFLHPLLFAFYIEEKSLRNYIILADETKWITLGKSMKRQKRKKKVSLLLKKMRLYNVLNLIRKKSIKF